MKNEAKENKFFNKAQNLFNKTKEKASNLAVKNISKQTNAGNENVENQIAVTLDTNESTQLYMENIIKNGLSDPINVINRNDYLQMQLQNYCSQDVINTAIGSSPMQANIPTDTIDKIANLTIKIEQIFISNLSTNESTKQEQTPSNDLTIAYCNALIRITQKLIYLYGFPQIELNEQSSLSNATNTLTICFGVMYGINGTSKALKAISSSLGKGVGKQLEKNDSLLATNICTIANKISKCFDKEITKKDISGMFNKAINYIGNVASKKLTEISFKSCCEKLKKSLQDTLLSNPNYNAENEFLNIAEISREIENEIIVDADIN